jgi:anthranilate phosphoribosyltransferase
MPHLHVKTEATQDHCWVSEHKSKTYSWTPAAKSLAAMAGTTVCVAPAL